jgi:hypothetical protein
MPAFLVPSVLLSVIAAGSGEPAQAAVDWRVMAWTDPVIISVDAASITPDAARVTARVLWDYAAVQSSSDQADSSYQSMIGIMVFDCDSQRFGGAGSVSYSGVGGRGEAIARSSVDPSEAQLSYPEPGSLGHDLLAFVCTHAGKVLR